MKIVLNSKPLGFVEIDLEDNPTVQDFLSLLPFSLEFEEYNQTEIISFLPRNLTTIEAPKSHTPKIGEIAYSAPWGNIAIFYKNFSKSEGLIKLGKINCHIESINKIKFAKIRLL